MKKIILATIGVVCLLLTACNSKPNAIPTAFSEATDSAQIYPDYRDVTIPPNIAPLNFMVMDSTADAFVADIEGLVCGADASGKMDIDTTAWRNLLQQRRGQELNVAIYARRSGNWVRQPGFTLHVAEERQGYSRAKARRLGEGTSWEEEEKKTKAESEKGPDRSALGHPVSRQHGEGGEPGRGGHRA